MSKPAFFRIVRQYIHNKLSKEEQARLDAWIDSLSTQEEEEQIIWREQEQEALFKKISSQIKHKKDNSGKPVLGMEFWLKAAASLLLLVTASYFVVKVSEPQKQVAAHNEREDEKRILPDGTIVWLKKHSELTYAEIFNERYAKLTGEGFFEVAKDAEHPFIIQCGEMTVTVLGTSFNLKVSRDSVELKLLTGKVNFSSIANPAGLQVVPNERVLYTAQTGIKKYALQPHEVKQVIANTGYNMNFIHARFVEVVQRIEQKFEVTITLSDSEMEECHINLDITDHSLQSSLQMITSVLNVEYKIKGDKVLISGSGCKP